MSSKIKWFLIILVCSVSQRLHAQTGDGPPCREAQQVNIASDDNKRKLLVDFIRSCEQSWGKYNKGIVLLREYHNQEGKLCWLLLPSIDDEYKDNPPNRFADLDGDIILVFEAESNGLVLKPTVGDKDRLNQCLAQIIGDRVYTRPTIKTRWTSCIPIADKKIKVARRRLYGGNGGSLIIVFNADGSYEKLIPV